MTHHIEKLENRALLSAPAVSTAELAENLPPASEQTDGGGYVYENGRVSIRAPWSDPFQYDRIRTLIFAAVTTVCLLFGFCRPAQTDVFVGVTVAMTQVR